MSVKNSKSGKIKAVAKSAASRTTTAKTALVKTAARQTPDAVDEAGLLADLRGLIAAAHRRVATVANATHTMLCWHVGRRLLKENLLEGRAAYGKQILVTVSRELTAEYGRGFSYAEIACMIYFSQLFHASQPASHALVFQGARPRRKSVTAGGAIVT